MQMFALSSLLIILSFGMKQKETCEFCYEVISYDRPSRRTICCDITNYHKDCYFQALDNFKKCPHCNTSFQAIMKGKNRRVIQWKFQDFAKKYQKFRDDDDNNVKEAVRQLCQYMSGLKAWKSEVSKISIERQLSYLEEENEELLHKLNSEAKKLIEEKNKNYFHREKISKLYVSLGMKNQEEEGENECLRKENRQIKKGYQILSEENAEQRRLNEKLRQEKNEFNEKIEDLKKNISRVQEEKDGVCEENENVKKENRKLKKFYEKFNKKDTFFKKENQYLREQLENPELRKVRDEWNNLQKQNLFCAENEKIKEGIYLNERNFCKERTSMHSEIAELREKIKTLENAKSKAKKKEGKLELKIKPKQQMKIGLQSIFRFTYHCIYVFGLVMLLGTLLVIFENMYPSKYGERSDYTGFWTSFSKRTYENHFGY